MDLLNYDDEKICGNCQGVGRVKKSGELICQDEEINVANAQKAIRKVSDLTIPEFKALMVECFEMLKQRETDTSVKEYKRLTIDDISTRNGVPVPKEY